MKRKEIIENVAKKTEELTAGSPIGLFDVEVAAKGGTNVLTVKLTSEEGVGLDDCHRIHVLLSAWLDELDPFEDSYILEVASPGLDAPLKSETALRNSIGREVYVKTYVAAEDRPKAITGRLTAYDGDSVTVTDDERTYTVERKMIATIRLHFKF